MRARLLAAASLLLAGLSLSTTAQQPRTAAGGNAADADWPLYRRDQAGTGYSPLKQITLQNVANLAPSWTFRIQSTAGANVNSQATPIVIDDLLYVLADNGVLSCYEVETGALVYQERVSPVAGSFSASPVAAAGRLYMAAEDGTVYVVSAGRRFAALAANPIGEPLMATPAISGSLLIIRGAGHLFAVGTA